MRQPRSQVDFGSYQVHKKVFAEIIAETLENIEGASLAKRVLSQRFFALFQPEDLPGVDVDLDEQDNVSVRIFVHVRPGYNIPDLSRVIETSVRQSVERMLNIDLKDVQVVVVGLERSPHDLP